MIFSKVIFNLGQKLRNPSLENWLTFLKTSEKWSIDELEVYQLQQLKKLVEVAYTNSNFYNQKFKEHGVSPSTIEILKDIEKLPIISKKELLNFNEEISTKGSFKKLFKANTSGSTGDSLKFKREESADSFNRASIFRGYSWYSVKPWERNGYFWGFNFYGVSKIKTEFLDMLQNRFRLFSYHKKELDAFSKKLNKATYLHGYSSMIYNLAKYINAHHLKLDSNLKMVKGTSEKIYESYQNEVEKAFGLKMISEYGAAETGIIAFECPSGAMHINMEGVLVEELDNEIVVTNLQQLAFPIIRYKLGDYVKLAPKEKICSCGMKHRILEEVTGRIGSLVYGKEHTYPSLYFYYIFKNLAKNGMELTYQVEQHKKGKLIFLIEQQLSEIDLKLVKNEIYNYFKEDVDYSIAQLKEQVLKDKKHQSFISSID
ncbi:phenylacetate--CoA ligase family protein [uncultured Lutibacter sp.]|uniref:phenylacetate--CoA ligase family protein n=1 Tax=uncultured Lutibacter sp. TaxID=437739 RepID=UPI0026352AD9|nr:phenylacetate--CoA ligase family protein [uncultured Lutibacter sp.]